MSMKTISDRLKDVINSEIEEYRRGAALAVRSGIAADSWKKFLAGKQRPTLEMLQWAYETWPQYAFWISTGIDDQKFGHGNPNTYTVNQGKKFDNAISREYFSALIKMEASSNKETNQTQKGLLALNDLDVIKLRDDEVDQELKLAHIFEKIRWIDIFLGSYATKLNIDDAINTYNDMRSIAKKLQEKASLPSEKYALEALLIKFAEVKVELETMRDRINAEIIDRSTPLEKK